MKNGLAELRNQIFEMIVVLENKSLEGGELSAAINMALALNTIASSAIANAVSALKRAGRSGLIPACRHSGVCSHYKPMAF